MSGSKRYVLDANAFIEAKNRYYGLDICPGFWDALVAQHDAKRIFSIDRIRAELVEQESRAAQSPQPLSDWMNCPKHLQKCHGITPTPPVVTTRLFSITD
jgi:hypothetical protein